MSEVLQDGRTGNTTDIFMPRNGTSTLAGLSQQDSLTGVATTSHRGLHAGLTNITGITGRRQSNSSEEPSEFLQTGQRAQTYVTDTEGLQSRLYVGKIWSLDYLHVQSSLPSKRPLKRQLCVDQ